MSVELSDVADALVAGGAQPLRGRLRVPGDKSISHRALIFAALAPGASTITNLATGADVHATARVLAQLGVTIESEAGAVVVHGTGVDGPQRAGRRARLREQRYDDAGARRACSRAGRSCRC